MTAMGSKISEVMPEILNSNKPIVFMHPIAEGCMYELLTQCSKKSSMISEFNLSAAYDIDDVILMIDVQNDFVLSSEDIGIMIFDEAHRAKQDIIKKLPAILNNVNFDKWRIVIACHEELGDDFKDLKKIIIN